MSGSTGQPATSQLKLGPGASAPAQAVQAKHGLLRSPASAWVCEQATVATPHSACSAGKRGLSPPFASLEQVWVQKKERQTKSWEAGAPGPALSVTGSSCQSLVWSQPQERFHVHGSWIVFITNTVKRTQKANIIVKYNARYHPEFGQRPPSSTTDDCTSYYRRQDAVWAAPTSFRSTEQACSFSRIWRSARAQLFRGTAGVLQNPPKQGYLRVGAKTHESPSAVFHCAAGAAARLNPQLRGRGANLRQGEVCTQVTSPVLDREVKTRGNTSITPMHAGKRESKTGISVHVSDFPDSQCSNPDAASHSLNSLRTCCEHLWTRRVGGWDHRPGATTPQHPELKSRDTHCPGDAGTCVASGHHFSLQRILKNMQSVNVSFVQLCFQNTYSRQKWTSKWTCSLNKKLRTSFL